MADKHINKRWTDKEVEILKKLYPKGGYREVKKLLPHRTSRAISEKSRSLGIFSNSRQKYFSKEEIEILKTYYPIGGLSLVKKYITDRSDEVIYNKASQLNLKCRDDLYTSDEDEIIRKYYPSLGLSKVRDMLPNRTETSIHQRASSLGVKYLTYNKDFFEKINTYEKAYWLGFIYADGYVTTNNRWGVSLGIEDIEHLEKLLSAFECNVKIRIRDKEEKFGYNSGARYKECSFLINNSKMHKDLINNGVIPNKTKKLAFPSKEVLPLELRSHFIRGYFDGDGSYVFYRSEEIRKDRNNRVYNRLKKEISLVCASYNFINSISEILRDECGINKRLFVTKRDNLHILRLQSKSDMKLFIDYVYKNSTVHLERKFKKAQEILEYCLT